MTSWNAELYLVFWPKIKELHYLLQTLNILMHWRVIVTSYGLTNERLAISTVGKRTFTIPMFSIGSTVRIGANCTTKTGNENPKLGHHNHNSPCRWNNSKYTTLHSHVYDNYGWLSIDKLGVFWHDIEIVLLKAFVQECRQLELCSLVVNLLVMPKSRG